MILKASLFDAGIAHDKDFLKIDVASILLQDYRSSICLWYAMDHFLADATCSLEQVPSDQISPWKTAGDILNTKILFCLRAAFICSLSEQGKFVF